MRRVAALVLLVLLAAADDDAAKIKLLIARLRSPDKRARATAAAELGDLGPRANGAINALAKALGDDDWWVRSRALEALKKIGPDAVPALVRAVAGSGKDRADIMRLLDESFAGELKPHLRTVAGLLRDRDQRTRGHAAHALGQQGEVAIDVLIPALGAREEGAQEAAIKALCGVGAIAIDPLLQTLAGGSDRARAGAALALGSLKASSAGEALVVALADKSQEVGGAAARGLGAAGAVPEQAIPLLLEGLRSPNAPFREGCIDGLIAYGEKARDAVATALDADDTRAPMSLALLRNGEAGFPTLRGVIHGGSVASRHAALAIVRRTMAAVVSDDLIVAVVGCLRHEDASVRADAAHTLEGLGPRAKGKDLETAAADPDPAVRAAAVRALGALGVKAGNHDDKDPFVRIEAMLAGWRTGGSGAEELTKIAFDAATEPRVRAAAVTALGDMGLPAASIDLTPLVADQPVEVRRAAAEALGKITRPSAFAIRDARAAADLNPAVEAGLAWLAGAQGTDGEWERGKLTAGTTGLALMAFLAAGRGPSDERHGLAVRRGLAYLTSRQDKRGILSSRESHEFVVCHGIATVALIEGWMLGGGDGCRRAAQPALDFIAFARNPGLAWRYEPRGGENDTHVTTWMVMALKLGDAAGLRVDAEAYPGAALWLEKMADPESGRIGYDYPGGNSARPEDLNGKFPAEFVESMTAAGLWCRQLLGVAPLRGPLEGKGINLLLARPPSQELNSRDFIYWHFGALALFQYGDAPYSKWEKPLSAALAESWDPNGSWKPEDVWSAEGGPVYTTSMAILTLLTRTRYPRDFLTRPKLSPATRAAITALKKACADEDPQVREIATAACARLGG